MRDYTNYLETVTVLSFITTPFIAKVFRISNAWLVTVLTDILKVRRSIG